MRPTSRSARAAFQRRARTALKPRRAAPVWTDLNESDPGVALLELFAYLGDTLAYYQDAIAAEQRRRGWRYVLAVGTLGLALLAWWWTRDGNDDD